MDNYRILIAFVYCLLAAQISLAAQTNISQDTIEIKEVVVSQKKAATLTGMSQGKIVLKPTALSSLPSILGNLDMLGILKLTPGVQNAGDSNTNMYIRGGEPGQNLLLYNNAPVYTPGHLLGVFPLFNADHLSSLELHASSINPRFGGRLSSAMEVKSKSVIPKKPGVKGSVGLISSQATVEMPLGEKFAAYLSGRKTYLSSVSSLPGINDIFNGNRGRKNRANNNELKIENIGYDFHDINVTLIGNLSEQHRLTFDMLTGKDNLDISEPNILLNGYLEWGNLCSSIAWDYRPAEDKKLHQSIFFSDYSNLLHTSQAALQMDIKSRTRSMGYNALYSFPIQDADAQIGMQYSHLAANPQLQQTQNIGILFSPNPDTLHRADNMAVFASIQRELLPQLHADIGIRYVVFFSGSASYQAVEPRMSLRYQLAENNYLRASFNRHNQYMHLLSSSQIGIPCDFWAIASDDIPPQSGNTFSTGYYRIFAGTGYELSADIYYRSMNNLSEYDYNVTNIESKTFAQSVLSGKGKAYGLELMLKKNWGKLTGWLSYTLSRSERQFDGINEGRVFSARYDRRHDFSAVAAYTFNSRWDVSLVQVFSSGGAYTLPSSWYFMGNTPIRQYGEYNGARMPNYSRTDVSVNYWFRKDNGLNLSVFNSFMVRNPIYIFLSINHDKEEGKITMNTKNKLLSTIIPSISWRFNY